MKVVNVNKLNTVIVNKVINNRDNADFLHIMSPPFLSNVRGYYSLQALNKSIIENHEIILIYLKRSVNRETWCETLNKLTNLIPTT